ncbi:MAG: HDOD domain-containing protein [Planctomycetota bacterium]
MIQQRFDELRLTGALPSPSAIGLRILELTQDENYDQGELILTIMADPALSGRVVQMANSVLHAGAEPVETVREAALRLGSKSVRSLALGFSLVERGEDRQLGGLDHRTFWSRSLATAVATSVLAFECRAFSPGRSLHLRPARGHRQTRLRQPVPAEVRAVHEPAARVPRCALGET